MEHELLRPKPTTLLVFIDETGNEDYSDPKNPTFGRGGCAVIGRDYHSLIKKPWRHLKRERLGGATKPFHATEFEQTRPNKRQINGINSFLRKPFWRFSTMSDSRTEFPTDIDGHRAISVVTINFIRQLMRTYNNVTDVALIFEASGRGDNLVKRDFDLANLNLVNGAGKLVEVEGCFMGKSSLEPGLEVADLIVHTSGRQRRHEVAGKEGKVKDFECTFWHSPIPPAFMSIDNKTLTELAATTQPSNPY